MSDSGTGYWKPTPPALPAGLVPGALLIVRPNEISIGGGSANMNFKLVEVREDLANFYQGERVWLVGDEYAAAGWLMGRTQILVWASAIPDALERGRATSGGRPA